MLALDEKTIRASFINASRKEVSDLTLPADFTRLDWNKLDYLGWCDPKYARRAYIVVPVDGQLVGILLKRAEGSARSRPQCSWCEDVYLPNDVVLYTARRGGAAGRNGNTVGTLICAEFECSVNVRKPPRMAYIGFDVEAAREKRIATLRERAETFAADLLSDV